MSRVVTSKSSRSQTTRTDEETKTKTKRRQKIDKKPPNLRPNIIGKDETDNK